MIIVGWVAWDDGKQEIFGAGYHGARKVYKTEKIALLAVRRRCSVIPVYADIGSDPKVEPERICRQCKNPENDHPYRHPFVPL